MIPIQQQLNGVFLPYWLMQISSITNSAKVAYCVLATHTKQNGRLLLDIDGLADVMGTTRTRFLSHVNELVRSKFIERTEDNQIRFLDVNVADLKESAISLPAISEIQRPALSTRGSSLDPNWIPPIEDIEKMRVQFPLIDIKLEHEKFIDYWLSKTGKSAIKKDWIRVWRNWMRNAEQYRKARENNRRTSTELRHEKFDESIQSFR